MIDSLTSENHRDFAARYNGTWGFYLSDEGKKTLVRVAAVDGGKVTFADTFGTKYFGVVDKGVRFEFIPVNKGYYNARHSIYWLYRHPARQWQRGIHENNTRCFKVVENGRYETCPLSDAVSEIFNTSRTQKEVDAQAYEEYKNMQRSIFALSKHFAICHDKVWFYEAQIGVVTPYGRTLKVDHPIISQELNDTIRRSEYEFTVEVS